MTISPYIIAISNRKGGTGKTTVSVNIAAELAALGKRVLLVDLDTQGHCAVGLGVNATPPEHSVHNLFIDPTARLADAIRDTDFPNLFLAPADQLFEHGSGVRDVRRLANALAEPEIKERFDVVIVDTPPSFDVLLLNALSVANWVLVPYVPHHLSFEGVRQLMRVLFKVMSGENPSLKILGFLPMMVAQHIRQHRAISGEVSRQFGAHRVMSGIRNDIRLAESFAAGKPIRYYAPKSRAAEDFAQLGAVLVQLCS
ncbi:ParA family protein [Methylobacter tundripaludum]|uniref:Cobyrinic acid ac-diamide synthase n=1 Tax=Methylobacter tundripaludum (strain ATCC BAA-1195 / DSM 17260 / SV96) TaxID=697282 RepID=G3IWX6_METTV|nr:ParA family protein [Methylobacter tundripaludum]EGW23331.1 Cobyrinic acid ac-diamide synthase [Methylobacter tundripaludum SV96]